MKLNEETRKVIGKERPWLLDLIPGWASAFYVQLIDLDILDLRPDACKSATTVWYLLDTIFLIDKNGRVIGEVGKGFERKTYRVEWRWKKTFPFLGLVEIWGDVYSPETVENALHRIKGAENTRYILHIRGRNQPIVVLHKLPNSISSMEEQLKRKNAEEASKTLQALREG